MDRRRNEITNNNEYLLACFNNVQSLIQFADQKVASILLVDSITIGIFISKATNFIISLSSTSFCGIITFLSGIVFIASNMIALYKGIIKVLKPSFAKHYEKTEFSLFYFEHIASSEKDVILRKAESITEKGKTEEISAQIFEVSKILSRKNKQVSHICMCLFISLIAFLFFLFASSYL